MGAPVASATEPDTRPDICAAAGRHRRSKNPLKLRMIFIEPYFGVKGSGWEVNSGAHAAGLRLGQARKPRPAPLVPWKWHEIAGDCGPVGLPAGWRWPPGNPRRGRDGARGGGTPDV